MFLLCINGSKTNQFRTGVTVALGSTKTDLCPVAALLDYPLNRQGGAVGPLFLLENGTPLHRQAYVRAVQDALRVAGIDGSIFNSHSFRI